MPLFIVSKTLLLNFMLGGNSIQLYIYRPYVICDVIETCASLLVTENNYFAKLNQEVQNKYTTSTVALKTNASTNSK